MWALIGGRIREHVDCSEEIEFREILGGEAGIGDEIFAEDDQCFDRPVAHAFADGVEFRVGIFRAENQLAPVVFGLRSAATSRSSASPKRGTSDSKSVADFSRRAAG